MIDLMPELVGLFFTSFFAATLLPGGSEVILLALVAAYPDASVLALFTATVGNTLGGLTNWWLGRYLLQYQDRRWFPVNQTGLHRVQSTFTRFGQWSLLLSWLPIIGDALCLAAGVAKLPLLNSAILILIGKAARYAVLVHGTNAFLLS